MSDPAKASVVELVHVSFDRGTGEAGNPIRPVNQYWSQDGTLLAEFDHIFHAPDAAAYEVQRLQAELAHQPTLKKEVPHA